MEAEVILGYVPCREDRQYRIAGQEGRKRVKMKSNKTQRGEWIKPRSRRLTKGAQ